MKGSSWGLFEENTALRGTVENTVNLAKHITSSQVITANCVVRRRLLLRGTR